MLKPLHDEAGLTRVRVSTYQSVSGAGAQRMDALAHEAPASHDLVMDWSWEGDESDEEAKLRAETRKILDLPDMPISATCVRVPVMVGHSEAVWVELERRLAPEEAAEILRDAPSVRVLDLPEFPTPAAAAGEDEVLVGRIRRDTAAENGIALYLSSDNLRKGAALNAIQIAELLLENAAARYLSALTSRDRARRGRRKGLLDDAQNLRPPSLLHGDEAAQFQAAELDMPL